MSASTLGLLIISFLYLWLIGCAYFDIKQRKLPNWLTVGVYPLVLLFFLLIQQNLLGAALSSSFLAWIVAVVLTLPAYVVRWLGAGDVKMLSALGLMTGLQFMLFSYAVAGMLAGVIVVYSVLGQRYLPYLNLHLAKFGWQLPATTLIKAHSLPFGALLAFGGLVMLTLQITGTVKVVAAT